VVGVLLLAPLEPTQVVLQGTHFYPAAQQGPHLAVLVAREARLLFNFKGQRPSVRMVKMV
jgi:hypothetical protein